MRRVSTACVEGSGGLGREALGQTSVRLGPVSPSVTFPQVCFGCHRRLPWEAARSNVPLCLCSHTRAHSQRTPRQQCQPQIQRIMRQTQKQDSEERGKGWSHQRGQDRLSQSWPRLVQNSREQLSSGIKPFLGCLPEVGGTLKQQTLQYTTVPSFTLKAYRYGLASSFPNHRIFKMHTGLSTRGGA